MALVHREALPEGTRCEGGVGSRAGSLLPQFGGCWKGEWFWDASVLGGQGRADLGQGGFGQERISICSSLPSCPTHEALENVKMPSVFSEGRGKKGGTEMHQGASMGF